MKIKLSCLMIYTNFLIFAFGLFKKESAAMSKDKMEIKSHFTFEKFAIDKSQFKKFYTRSEFSYGTVQSHTPVEPLLSSLMGYTNSSNVVLDSNQFKKDNRKWDFKILDKQLEEILNTILVNQERAVTINGLRTYIELFVKNYQKCDTDNDNVLSISEFTECFSSDSYLSKITLPPKDPSNRIDFSNPIQFYHTLFDLLNEKRLSYLNFVDYMKLRLFLFSFNHCSVNGPFLDEVSFECAIEMASGYKTFSRTQARKLFRFSLDMSNNPNNVNLNFISFVNVASAIRLYGSINGKGNNDITRSELNLALDRNTLPDRYNQDIINHMFKLVQEEDRKDQGLDINTFIFLDTCLILFSPDNKSKKYYMALNEFKNSFFSYLFPFNILTQVINVPAYVISPQSYSMFQYMNISKFSLEKDYLYKFLELETKVDKILNMNEAEKEESAQPTILIPASINQTALSLTASLIFNTSDVDFDNYLTFYDYGIFMQVTQIFSKINDMNKISLSASQLYDTFTGYSDFPEISSNLRKKAERFNEFNRSTNLDVISTLQILRISDIANYFRTRSDNSNVLEIDLMRILHKVNMGFVVSNDFNKDCFRGVDYRNLPLFDWECCFNIGMKKNLEYFDSMNNFQIMKKNGFQLSSTAFYNVDPIYD